MKYEDNNLKERYSTDVEEVHAQMLKYFPKEISTIQGEFAFDSTRGCAEQACFTRSMIEDFFKLGFTKTSRGKYLEYIGETVNVFRKEATHSYGLIKVFGEDNTFIDKGTIFATEANEDIKSLKFETTESGLIRDGSATLKAKSVEGGVINNVKQDSIRIIVSDGINVNKIENTDFIGGADLEDEELLRKRIIEAQKQDAYSGADSDYERWAKEVEGVGYAYCRDKWNEAGHPFVYILDSDKKEASQELIDRVKEYIYPAIKEGQSNRGGKAPTGIKDVTVETITTKNLIVKISEVEITKGFDKEIVFEKIKLKLNDYLAGFDITKSLEPLMLTSIVGTLKANNEGLDYFKRIYLTDEDGIEIEENTSKGWLFEKQMPNVIQVAEG